MSIRTGLFCAAIGIAAIAMSPVAGARVYLDVNVAPPPPPEEVVPEARVGYVWAPGYYNYDGHRHVWVNGHYIHERRGHHWVADRWDEHDGRWHHERGHWD